MIPPVTPLDGGWIAWEGGECPVPLGADVQVKFRDGGCEAATPASYWASHDPAFNCWVHTGGGSDIVAYRLAPATPSVEGCPLLVLAERVEQATGPDRELDCAIAVTACGFFELPPKWEGGPVGYGYFDKEGAEIHPGNGGDQMVPRYTASLDAAMSLVDWTAMREWAYWFILETDDFDPAKWCARFDQRGDESGNGDTILAVAATPALALCAASLRARASLSSQGGDHG